MRQIPTPAHLLDRSDRDTLHLLVQSPTVLFIYWQLSVRKRAMVQEHFGADWQALQPTLRIYDITGLSFDGSSANEVSELALPQGESCFLRGFHPGKSYIADLGIVGGDGYFLPILRSNSVESPLIESVAVNPLSQESSANHRATPSPFPISFTVVKPIQYEQFSAYSVYPHPQKMADSEPGGDSD
ncbi:DUF4912 domain-containing protein [Paenibacillus sp. WST5]|uniref:DUF4912 domain-containing protein n=1 Tax=Paenibacillus sedimenti TaxID=2770274 RepID=A0A926KN70_9BACL|nr:DUF4912 domain-containing protein [Paenibacillus sedimenti]